MRFTVLHYHTLYCYLFICLALVAQSPQKRMTRYLFALSIKKQNRVLIQRPLRYISKKDYPIQQILHTSSSPKEQTRMCFSRTCLEKELPNESCYVLKHASVHKCRELQSRSCEYQSTKSSSEFAFFLCSQFCIFYYTGNVS